MKIFNLEVITPEKIFYNGPCVSLKVPLEDGEYGIMANHENIVGAITEGLVKISKDGKEEIVGVCSEGILKIVNNTVYVLVDTIEYPDEIDEVLAREEIQRAEEELKYANQRRDRFIAETELKRAVNRLKAKKQYRKY